MAWPCRLITLTLEAERSGAVDLRIGDMWEAPWLLEGSFRDVLSEHYWKQWAGKRPPLLVRMPGRWEFSPDVCSRQHGVHVRDTGWHVFSTPPMITVQPSVNAEGIYHGWIRAGFITDDYEGRRYDV